MSTRNDMIVIGDEVLADVSPEGRLTLSFPGGELEMVAADWHVVVARVAEAMKTGACPPLSPDSYRHAEDSLTMAIADGEALDSAQVAEFERRTGRAYVDASTEVLMLALERGDDLDADQLAEFERITGRDYLDPSIVDSEAGLQLVRAIVVAESGERQKLLAGESDALVLDRGNYPDAPTRYALAVARELDGSLGEIRSLVVFMQALSDKFDPGIVDRIDGHLAEAVLQAEALMELAGIDPVAAGIKTAPPESAV